MVIKLSRSWLTSLKDLLVNLSAGWFAAALISPAFSSIQLAPLILIGNLFNAIFYLYLSVKLDELLQ